MLLFHASYDRYNPVMAINSCKFKFLWVLLFANLVKLQKCEK